MTVEELSSIVLSLSQKYESIMATAQTGSNDALQNRKLFELALVKEKLTIMRQLLAGSEAEGNDFLTLAILIPAFQPLSDDLNYAFNQLKESNDDEMNKIRYDAAHYTIEYLLHMSERQVYDKELSPGDENKITELIQNI